MTRGLVVLFDKNPGIGGALGTLFDDNLIDDVGVGMGGRSLNELEMSSRTNDKNRMGKVSVSSAKKAIESSLTPLTLNG